MLSKIYNIPFIASLIFILVISSCEDALDHEDPNNQVITEIVKDTVIVLDTVYETEVITEIVVEYVRDTVRELDTIYLDNRGNHIDFQKVYLSELISIQGEPSIFQDSPYDNSNIEFNLEIQSGSNYPNQEFGFDLQFVRPIDNMEFPLFLSYLSMSADNVPFDKTVNISRPQHRMNYHLLLNENEPLNSVEGFKNQVFMHVHKFTIGNNDQIFFINIESSSQPDLLGDIFEYSYSLSFFHKP